MKRDEQQRRVHTDNQKRRLVVSDERPRVASSCWLFLHRVLSVDRQHLAAPRDDQRAHRYASGREKRAFNGARRVSSSSLLVVVGRRGWSWSVAGRRAGARIADARKKTIVEDQFKFYFYECHHSRNDDIICSNTDHLCVCPSDRAPNVGMRASRHLPIAQQSLPCSKPRFQQSIHDEHFTLRRYKFCTALQMGASTK